MTISEIYEKYQIVPHLQLHMLRVAGIGKLISDNYLKKINENLLISACALHDIGNNIKMDFRVWMEEIDGIDFDYWKKIKQEFIAKYGDDADQANIKIVKEMGVDNKIINIIKGMGHYNLEKIYKSDNYELKIIEYADYRVRPTKIASLEERVSEWFKRYEADLTKDGFDQKKYYFC